MPKVDFSQVKELDFSPMPNGIYNAVLDEWELKEGNKGDYYNITFVLPEENNRKIWLILSIAPGALWRFKRDMIRLGADPELMAPESDTDTDDIVASVVGTECRLKLKQEEYESNDIDENGNRIKKVRSVIDEVLAPSVRV